MNTLWYMQYDYSAGVPCNDKSVSWRTWKTSQNIKEIKQVTEEHKKMFYHVLKHTIYCLCMDA